MLTDLDCRNAVVRRKPYRLNDGGSLFIVVRPSGAKSWEYRYKRDGAVRGVILGAYPERGLRKARTERDRMRAEVQQGVDPVAQRGERAQAERAKLAVLREQRRQERQNRQREAATLKSVAGKWIEEYRHTWTPKHAAQIAQSLADHVYPRLGQRRIDTLGTADVLEVLGGLIAEGKLETASRIKQRLGAIFEFAILKHLADRDPVALIRREFAKRMKAARRVAPKGQFAAVKLAQMPALLKALHEYSGTTTGRRLVELIMLTACRTGEARGAKWSEFDFDRGVWTIPAARMKARKAHEIPLSRQAIDLLQELQLESRSDFVFPHPTKPGRPASENAALYVLAAVGFKGAMTGHGFRSLFSTAANESGLWRSDVIEAALAHGERDDVREAYNRTSYFEERKRLMQWWADEIDRIREGRPAKVARLSRGAGRQGLRA